MEQITVTQPECARLLGVSVRTVRRLVAEGRLTTVKLHPNGHPLIRHSDVERLVAGEVVKSP
jgi:excisionase family DNA binding protein